MIESEGTKLGRRLAALRPREVMTCAHCGQRFAAYPYAQYCSPRCRVAAFRERQRKPVGASER